MSAGGLLFFGGDWPAARCFLRFYNDASLLYQGMHHDTATTRFHTSLARRRQGHVRAGSGDRQAVQIDEPVLVTELDADWQHAFNFAYHHLKSSRVKLLLATYFGTLQENLHLACNLPVAGLHLDAINARDEIQPLLNLLPSHKVLSLGVINGRNIWKTDLNATLDWLEPFAARLGERLWIAPSCSLLHVPVDLASEQKLDVEIKSWLAYALQKLDELKTLATALNNGRAAVATELAANQTAIAARRTSPRVTNPAVRAAIASINPALGQRKGPYPVRARKQAAC